MFGFLARRLIAMQERVTGQSAAYMRDIYAGSPAVFWRFAFASSLYHYSKALPPEVYSVAGIAAVRAEDCGPCVQISVNLALKAGISPGVIRAAATGAVEELSDDNRLAYEFAYAVATRDLDAEGLRPEVERRWGKAGLAEIAFAVANTRSYPTLKRAMGYAQACRRVTIGGETAIARPREAA